MLACGQGQWGSLGNGLYSSAQSDPSRIKAVSGLVEYSEQEGKVTPLDIHFITVSPTGHAMLVFETLARAGPGGIRGRDMVIWGQNKDYELGNGKRGTLATPVNLAAPSGMPFMLLERESEVYDMGGKLWAAKRLIRQTPVAGNGCSVVYWKITN